MRAEMPLFSRRRYFSEAPRRCCCAITPWLRWRQLQRAYALAPRVIITRAAVD